MQAARISVRRTLRAHVCCALILAAGSLCVTQAVADDTTATHASVTSIDARAAFERLAAMAGAWNGHLRGEGEAEEEAAARDATRFRYRLASGGTVVMETMNEGSEYEMISMYHLDGDDLVLTHYCSGGNQPRMVLDRDVSTPERMIFVFDGGTNLDPAVDQHIHGIEIETDGADHVVSRWRSHQNGEEIGRMSFDLRRDDSSAP